MHIPDIALDRGNRRAELHALASLTEGRERGLRFLLSHLKPAGDGCGSFFHGPAQSRGLETALTLHVLRQARIEPEWQERLRGYLLKHAEGADAISKLAARAVLEQMRPDELTGLLHTLTRELEYGRRRKQALLLMLMVELGCLPLERARVEPEDFAAQAAHRFSQLYCAALRMIHRRHAGGGALHDEQDAALLESSQSQNGSWEQQSLITVVAMMGLGPAHPAFRRGLEYLRRVEREDGGIPFIHDHDTWMTAVAGLALRAGQARPEVQQEVARFIASRQHTNGGWSFREEVTQTDVDCTANCAQVLLQGDARRFEQPLDRALAYFRALQRDDGGYPTYEREGESEVSMTANVLLVQSLSVRRRPELRSAMRRASAFLLERQTNDGRFEKSWSLCETYSIFRVMWALHACQAAGEAADASAARARACGYLLASQRADGGWGQTGALPSDAVSTAYALSALSVLREHHPVPPSRVDRAVVYLLTQQEPATGEIVSISDMVGPRPIPYDVPLMSTAWSVLALSLALEGLGLEQRRRSARCLT
ncbi:prenyltransferase/squalene oxidase repeat-containing protein [Sorangium sp. So ce1128]